MGVEGEGLWAFLGEWKDFWGVSAITARAQDTKSGSKIVDLGFVKFKSNCTTAKRPLKQIQKTQEAKEKQTFWFSLGVLNGFSRKSNEDEFPRKSNGGWIFLGIKRGLQKK